MTCCELAPVVGELAANLDAAAAAIERAARDADVVVLPELVTSGYCFASADEARTLALAADDPVFAEWHAAAGGAVVVAGFAELGADDRLYNSAVLIDADGRRTVYRKTHLWDREPLVFTAGAEPPPVIDTAVGPIGVLICYDIEFPELTRALALAGAELLVVPVNWPLVPRPAGERPPEVVIAMAAARVNRMAIACCDRRGTERGTQWTSGTTIVAADGWPVAVPGPDGFARACIDPAAARDKSISPRNDLFGDRRPALYASGPRYSPLVTGDGRSCE